jgi:glycosyltransferase involved in cell wall biosynthesis
MVNQYCQISIVTACRNCDKYIEQTISSILGQRYPNIQYILIDGASTDSTMTVVQKHNRDINIIISEPDAGQYHGIQKGFEIASGEVMAWLNADDIYYPWTFSVVNAVFKQFPEVEWLIGRPSYMNFDGQCISISGNSGTSYPSNYISNGWFRPPLSGYLQQESMFWRKSLWDKVGGLNLDFKYAADFELWTRFAAYSELYSVTIPLALFRKRPGEQKSSVDQDKYEREVNEICRNLKSAPCIWGNIARKGKIWEHLCRLLIWKRCKLITYSERESEWSIKTMIRPLSRISIEEALLLAQIERY